MGQFLASLIFLYNVTIGSDLRLCFTVALSLFTVIIIASVFGTLVPLVLNKYKIDPSIGYRSIYHNN